MKAFSVGLVGLGLCMLALVYLGRWIALVVLLIVLVSLVKAVGDFIGRVVTAIFEEVFHKPPPQSKPFKG